MGKVEVDQFYIAIGKSQIVHIVRPANPLTLCNRYSASSWQKSYSTGYGLELCGWCLRKRK